jgi:hypothetical protein
VVAVELVDREADRHEGETHDRQASAHDQRKAFEVDHRDGERVHRAGRHATDARPVTVEAWHQREHRERQRHRNIPDGDVEPLPPLPDPPEVDHTTSVAAEHPAAISAYEPRSGHESGAVNPGPACLSPM